MTPEQAIELGRAWAAAGWAWAPGQAYIAISRVHADVVVTGWRTSSDGWCPSDWEAVPDMRDRGTLGHALGQVRDAWGDPWLYLEAAVADHPGRVECDSFWIVVGPTGGVITGDTEAEALLAARRAAP